MDTELREYNDDDDDPESSDFHPQGEYGKIPTYSLGFLFIASIPTDKASLDEARSSSGIADS